VLLQIHDVRGRLVHRQSKRLSAGTHALRWDGRDLHGNAVASGIYPYLLRAGSQQLRSRAVLAR
jgi:flagellar hook assembly protein FlgD